MALRARPLGPSEPIADLPPAWRGATHARESAALDASLIILDGDAPVAVAAAERLPAGVRVHGVHLTPDTALGDVLAAVVAAHPGARVEVAARDPGAALEEHAWRAGFDVARREVVVRGTLDRARRPAHRPFTFRTADELGRAGLRTLLAALWHGGPTPSRFATAGEELDQLLHHATPAGRGARPATALWRVAYRDGDPAGVILARVDGDQGALAYLGLLPALRGQGLGRALHAEALWLLRTAGARAYEDATTVDNAPMRRLFARAGLTESATALLLVHDPRPAPAEQPARTTAPTLPRGAHTSLLAKAPIGSVLIRRL